MNITQEQLNEAILEVTGMRAWDIIKKGLEHDIYNTQARAFDAQNWGDVKELKGFAQGLSYVIGLRELVSAQVEQAKQNEAFANDANV